MAAVAVDGAAASGGSGIRNDKGRPGVRRWERGRQVTRRDGLRRISQEMTGAARQETPLSAAAENAAAAPAAGRLEAACYFPLLSTWDRDEGLRAFAEQRQPVFRGE